MSDNLDLEQRLRSVAGPAPDTEAALTDVMGRIQRRRRVSSVAGAVVVLIAMVGATWLVTRPGDEGASVFVGQPTTTTEIEVEETSAAASPLRELWTAEKIGMGQFAADSGQIVVASNGTVFAAEGHGANATGPGDVNYQDPVGRVTAVDGVTGAQRWTTDLGADAFLQGVVGQTLIANRQYDRIVGLDVADGSVRWEVSLADLGLDGYGAVRSALSSPVSVIGVSASAEGDVRPPVLLVVDNETGAVARLQTLVEGTDLTWGRPEVVDGHAVFVSTLSHPESAPENVAHLINVADATVVWTKGLGGDQGFTSNAGIIDGDNVYLPGYPLVLAADQRDAATRWEHEGSGAMRMADGLWMFEPAPRPTEAPTIALVDPETGSIHRRLESPVAEPVRLVDLGAGRLGVVGRNAIGVLDQERSLTALQPLRAAFVDLAIGHDGSIAVATDDQAVTAYAAPQDQPTNATSTVPQQVRPAYSRTIQPPGHTPIELWLADVAGAGDLYVSHAVGVQHAGYGYDAQLYPDVEGALDPCPDIQPCVEIREATTNDAGLTVRYWAPSFAPNSTKPTTRTVQGAGRGPMLALVADYSGASVTGEELANGLSLDASGDLGATFTVRGGDSFHWISTFITPKGGVDDAPWSLSIMPSCEGADRCVDGVGATSMRLPRVEPIELETILVAVNGQGIS